ncbi:hypothetical protein [Endozoicomonas atrinae]|uniref:hypothetical protein n=1 Tax=Endozoicomonas atrinae TaxID=1333660 RepID=UPI003B009BF1
MPHIESLEAVLRRVNPDFFQAMMSSAFSIDLRVPSATGVRKQRKSLLNALIHYYDDRLPELNPVFEKILLLCDSSGQDALEAIRTESLPEDLKETFRTLSNQYHRSLWLYDYDQRLFAEALDKRQLRVLRRSSRSCAGFELPRGLSIDDKGQVKSFRAAMAEVLMCPIDAVAAEVIPRFEDEACVQLDHYEVRLHYNLPPESAGRVEQNQLIPCDILLATSAFMTYEPDNGALYVMSEDTRLWHPAGKAVAECLLNVVFTARPLDVITYDYQKLGDQTFQLNIGGLEGVFGAKVTLLGVRGNKSSLLVSSPVSDHGDIHSAGIELTQWDGFRFAGRRLSRASITIKLRPNDPTENERTAVINLSGESRCSFRYSREKDKRVCQRFLELNGLVRRIGNELSPAANDD